MATTWLIASFGYDNYVLRLLMLSEIECFEVRQG